LNNSCMFGVDLVGEVGKRRCGNARDLRASDPHCIEHFVPSNLRAGGAG